MQLFTIFKNRCVECEKVFNCPANLASHKRWHRPSMLLIDGNNQNVPKEKIENTSVERSMNMNEQNYWLQHIYSLKYLVDFMPVLNMNTNNLTTGGYINN